MSADCPDTTGYVWGRARELLAHAGVRVVVEQRVGPPAEACEGARSFVIRQRRLPSGEVALTVVGEWRSPLDRESRG
jgi:hypothetical protein